MIKTVKIKIKDKNQIDHGVKIDSFMTRYSSTQF